MYTLRMCTFHYILLQVAAFLNDPEVKTTNIYSKHGFSIRWPIINSLPPTGGRPLLALISTEFCSLKNSSVELSAVPSHVVDNDKNHVRR